MDARIKHINQKKLKLHMVHIGMLQIFEIKPCCITWLYILHIISKIYTTDLKELNGNKHRNFCSLIVKQYLHIYPLSSSKEIIKNCKYSVELNDLH
jgi:hypothetical protein